MFDNPYFGIVLSFLVFELIKKLNSKIHNGMLRTLANPLLLSIIAIALILAAFDIPYDSYNKGGSLISFLIGPATVALMVSLYENIHILKENIKPIILGIVVGSAVSMILTIILAKAFKVDPTMTITLLPESVTTAIALGLSTEYGGIAALTAISVIIRGTVGIIIAPLVIRLLNIYDPVAQGIGLGTVAHAMGTAKAREMGEIQGAMSGLSIALAGIVTVGLMPLMILLINLI